MVIVYVPTDVPEGGVYPPPPFPPPPQATKADTSTSAAKATTKPNRTGRCPAAIAKSVTVMSMSKRSVGSRKPKPGGPQGTEGGAIGRAVVVTRTVAVALFVPAGVTGLGLMEQVAADGAPLQGGRKHAKIQNPHNARGCRPKRAVTSVGLNLTSRLYGTARQVALPDCTDCRRGSSPRRSAPLRGEAPGRCAQQPFLSRC